MPATEAERLAVARALLLRHHIPARTVAPLRDGREHHLYRVGMTGGSSALLKVPREDRAPDPRWPPLDPPQPWPWSARRTLAPGRRSPCPRPAWDTLTV